jgi:hypothetical protein
VAAVGSVVVWRGDEGIASIAGGRRAVGEARAGGAVGVERKWRRQRGSDGWLEVEDESRGG